MLAVAVLDLPEPDAGPTHRTLHGPIP
jgi:hypothetical protein